MLTRRQKHELFKLIKPIFNSYHENEFANNTVQIQKKLTSIDRLQTLQSDIERLKVEGKFQDASDLLWKVLGINKNNTEAWLDLAYCAEQIERYDIVEVALWEALKRRDYNEEIYSKFLNIASRNHSNIEYSKLVKEAKHKLPKCANIRLMWAKVQDLIFNNQQKANKSYKKFLELADSKSQYNEIIAVQKLLKE